MFDHVNSRRGVLLAKRVDIIPIQGGSHEEDSAVAREVEPWIRRAGR